MFIQKAPTHSPTSDQQVRLLHSLAWVNVLLHLVALILAAVGMRPGSPMVSLQERLTYLGGSPTAWTCAWATWMLCATALIAFLAVTTYRLGNDAYLAKLGLIVAIAGAGFDLCCDSIYLLVFPMVASWQPPAEAIFLAMERATGIASLVIANGAYSVGILLVNAALRDRSPCISGTIGVGYSVAGFGLLLAGAGFTGVAWHAAVLTVPTIGLFCVWVVLVAGSLEPRGKLP